MISVLIPTYNYNIYPLVYNLSKQLEKTSIAFEIICSDDGSNSAINTENIKINTLKNSKFHSQKENVGLSNNRNILAELAQYKYLLFIDGDSLLPDDKFINKYIDSAKLDIDVIYGGRIHPKSVEPSRRLRWKYGVFREDSDVTKRNRTIYKSVLFNNTLIKKSLFNQIGFEKDITQYGHEDTVFAYKLSKLKASIKHIPNPVIHGDVDYNDVFFDKMHKSIKNLDSIYKTKLIDPNFITFLKVFTSLKKMKLNYLFAFTHKLFYKFFVANLTSKHPSLHIFDLFRLSYFCHINLKK